jgi:hypothetical protein
MKGYSQPQLIPTLFTKLAGYFDEVLSGFYQCVDAVRCWIATTYTGFNLFIIGKKIVWRNPEEISYFFNTFQIRLALPQLPIAIRATVHS